VREVELRVRFNCRLWSNSEDSRDSECARLDEPKDILRPITHHMNIAGPSAGIEASSKMLLSSIKGICFSYHYHPCYFERGFVKTERRRFPPKDFLKKPLEKLRQYHDDFDIPSNKLSININYGDPGWNVLACIGELDRSWPPRTRHVIISLSPVQLQIQVNDYDASVAAIDRELEVSKVAMDKIIEKICTRFSMSRSWVDIQELENMTNADMESLRHTHLRAIDEVTNFWKAQDGACEDGNRQTLK
jgi:hypothetical protein